MLQRLALLAHGLWVWNTPTVLAAPNGAETLRDFCRSQGITEVYVSVSGESNLAALVDMLHGAGIRAEALLSSTDADEPGPHRAKLIDRVREVERLGAFDGIHLDIEPQQRAENKGPGNLSYLPDLIDTFRAVRQATKLPVDVDIQTKVLKAPVEQRLALFTSVSRVTLMLYEQSQPDAGRMLDMAYQGLDAQNVATMAIALRTPDYGDRLPQALQAIDDAERGNPHYAGWARHSYNDVVQR